MKKLKYIMLSLILLLLSIGVVNASGKSKVMTRIMTDNNGTYFYWPSSLEFPSNIRINKIITHEIQDKNWTTKDGKKVRRYVFEFSFYSDGQIGYYDKYKSKIKDSIFNEKMKEESRTDKSLVWRGEYPDEYLMNYVSEYYSACTNAKFDIKLGDKESYDCYGLISYMQDHWVNENDRNYFLNSEYASDEKTYFYGSSGEIKVEIALIGDEELSISEVPKKVDGLNMVVELDDGTYVTVDGNGNINTDPSYDGIIEDENGIISQVQENLPVPKEVKSNKNSKSDDKKKAIIAGVVGVIAGLGVSGATSGSSSNSSNNSNNGGKDFSKYGYYQDKDKNWWRTIYTNDGKKIQLEYDRDGILIGGVRDEGKGRYSIIDYELDKNKNVKYQRETFFDKDGKEQKYTEIKYSGSNKERNVYSSSDKKVLTEKTDFGKDGLYNQEIYDENGSLREKTYYTTEAEHRGSNVVNSSVTEKEVRYNEIYDPKGKKIESHRIEYGDKTTIFRYIGK